MESHELDYEIIGDDLQLVEIELDPNETVIAEAGAMNYYDEGITFETKMGDGSDESGGLVGKMFSAGKRALSGESVFLTHFTNTQNGKKRVAFAAAYPGKIIPVNLPDIDGEITCQKSAFLCAAYGTKVGVKFNKKLGAGFFGGEGFILQHLQGDGLAFIHASGTIIKKELNNQTILVDTGCLVAFTKDITYDIQRTGGLKSSLFGGEGFFLAKLSGTGTVYLQSLPFARLAARVNALAATK
tara:strand:- start:745 stop:1470 length:726 start_codon:yes stop_codon:yes gene_type:complete